MAGALRSRPSLVPLRKPTMADGQRCCLPLFKQPMPATIPFTYPAQSKLLSLPLPLANQDETLFSLRNHLTHGKRARHLSNFRPVPCRSCCKPPLSLRAWQATYFWAATNQTLISLHSVFHRPVRFRVSASGHKYLGTTFGAPRTSACAYTAVQCSAPSPAGLALTDHDPKSSASVTKQLLKLAHLDFRHLCLASVSLTSQNVPGTYLCLLNDWQLFGLGIRPSPYLQSPYTDGFPCDAWPDSTKRCLEHPTTPDFLIPRIAASRSAVWDIWHLRCCELALQILTSNCTPFAPRISTQNTAQRIKPAPAPPLPVATIYQPTT
ncbi:hypothetical protein LZ32DRAFT_107528 [Colletotrichum eremochloae]|nr:hypothetical protein LZ32DRAFT_107528 [Colletotrichum eremochloae]